METFEELECYRLARDLRKELVALAKALPADERFRLTDQLIRAARSITANIAEGFGRFHYQENLQFCRIARGSLSECLDHLNAALDERLVEEGRYERAREDVQHVWKVLNGYIAYLDRASKSK
jgi:four helix bundle protein